MSEQLQKTSPDTAASGESYFDGTTLQFIGYKILALLLCAVTLGLAFPWTLCMIQGWEARHTVIRGRRLKFDGSGGQLFGRYLLWVLLTIVTLGIYGLFLGLSVKKWTVKHTSYADGARSWESYFSGGAGGYLGVHILALLLTVFTLGIGAPWAKTMLLRWEAGHTHIGGGSLSFDGSGGQLLGKCLLLAVLTPLTLGIYALCFPVSYTKWLIKHTGAPGRPAPDQESPAAPDRAGPPESAPASGGSRAVPVLLCVVGAVVLFFLGPVLLPRVRQAANLVPNLYYRLHTPRQAQSQPIQRTLAQGLDLGNRPASPEAAPEAVYDVDYTQAIVGEWESYWLDSTGDLESAFMSFRSDGSYGSGGNKYISEDSDFDLGLTREEFRQFGTYYDGKYWYPGTGYDTFGSYRLEGNKLITILDYDSTNADIEPEEHTCTIAVEGDTLTFFNEQGKPTSQYTRKPKPNYTQAILGGWQAYALQSYGYGGTPILRWGHLIFGSDGTYYSESMLYIPPESAGRSGYEDLYYDGRSWLEVVTGHSEGTYSLEGETLTLSVSSRTITTHDTKYQDYAPPFEGTVIHNIEIEDDVLSLMDEYGSLESRCTRSN